MNEPAGELFETLEELAVKFSGHMSNATFIGTLEMFKTHMLSRILNETEDALE